MRFRLIGLLAAIAIITGVPLNAAFRAAAVKIDITPKTSQWLLGYGPRKSTGVLDPHLSPRRRDGGRADIFFSRIERFVSVFAGSLR